MTAPLKSQTLFFPLILSFYFVFGVFVTTVAKLGTPANFVWRALYGQFQGLGNPKLDIDCQFQGLGNPKLGIDCQFQGLGNPKLGIDCQFQGLGNLKHDIDCQFQGLGNPKHDIDCQFKGLGNPFGYGRLGAHYRFRTPDFYFYAVPTELPGAPSQTVLRAYKVLWRLRFRYCFSVESPGVLKATYKLRQSHL